MGEGQTPAEIALVLGLLSDEPCSLAYLRARALLEAGYTPLPVDPHDRKGKGKRPASACWIDGHWYPWRDQRPTEIHLRKWWPPGTRHQVGVILPGEVVCLDIEGPNGHPDLDLQAQTAVIEPIAQALLALPVDLTPSGGRHYFGRVPDDWRPASGCRKLNPEEVEVRCGGVFVRCYDPCLTLPAPEELPLMREEVLALFQRRRPRPRAPRQEEIPEEELAPWRQVVPDLKWTGNAAHGSCPLHDDNEPSLAVFRGRRGKLLWYCHAECPGSGPLHWGDLRDLRRRWLRTPRGEAEYTRLEGWSDQRFNGDASILARTVLAEAKRYRLDPREWMGGMSLRRLTRASGQQLDRCLGEGREAVLALSGRRITRLLEEDLPAHGFGVRKGTRDMPGQPGVATAIRFPAAAFPPFGGETVALGGLGYRSAEGDLATVSGGDNPRENDGK